MVFRLLLVLVRYFLSLVFSIICLVMAQCGKSFLQHCAIIYLLRINLNGNNTYMKQVSSTTRLFQH